MYKMEHTIYMKDAEVNRYLRAKLRELRPSEQLPEPIPEPVPIPEKLGKKIAWGPVLKIDPKEIEQKSV
jgi:hypothetical protein